MLFLKAFQLCLFPAYKVLYFVLAGTIKLDDHNADQRHVLFIANHISGLDPFLIVGQLSFVEFYKAAPVRAITANEFLFGHWYSFLGRLIGCYPAKPQKGYKHGLAASIDYAQNSSLIFFPEGARSTVHKIERLRTGAAQVVEKSDLKVMPIFIQKKNNAKLRNSFHVTQGEQFDAKGMTIEQMMDRVWSLKA